MWDQSVPSPRGRRVYPDADALFVYAGPGDQCRIHCTPGSGPSSAQERRQVKIRSSAIFMEAASRPRGRLVVFSSPMSVGHGKARASKLSCWQLLGVGVASNALEPESSRLVYCLAYNGDVVAF